VLNLATGGRGFGLRRFDYFQNTYYADVPYQITDGGLDVWIRLVPSPDARRAEDPSKDAAAREERLSRAVAEHAEIQIEGTARR